MYTCYYCCACLHDICFIYYTVFYIQYTLYKGKYRVLLKDKDISGVSRGEKTINDSLQSKLKKKKITNYEYNLLTSNLVTLHDNIINWKTHFKQADIVIEAVFEDLNVKHKVLHEMESVISNDCIFATNTSAIPIASIAAGAKRPENVIGK